MAKLEIEPYSQANRIQQEALQLFYDLKARRGDISVKEAIQLNTSLKIADRQIAHQLARQRNAIREIALGLEVSRREALQGPIRQAIAEVKKMVRETNGGGAGVKPAEGQTSSRARARKKPSVEASQTTV